MPELFEHALGLGRGVELQVNHHEGRIRNGTMNLVPTDAGRFSVDGVAIERSFPSIEVRNGVLNPEDWHSDSPVSVDASQLLFHRTAAAGLIAVRTAVGSPGLGAPIPIVCERASIVSAIRFASRAMPWIIVDENE